MKHAASISIKVKLALTIVMVFWASAFVGIRAALPGYSPGALALFRFLIASALMYGIYIRLPKRSKMSIADSLLLLVLGAATVATYHIALNYGEVLVPAGTASFIISQSPVITTFIAIIFLKERLSIYGYLGMAISVLGIIVIFLGNSAGLNFQIENLYILAAAIFGSFYSVLQKPFLKKYHIIDVTAYIIWGTTMPLLFYWHDLSQQIASASYVASASVIYLGIFPSAIAFVAWSYALNEMPASRAANFMYFMPLISTLLGWVLLAEIPLWTTLLGGLIALSGLWIVNKSYHWQLGKTKGPH